ncbi:hypothetical protein ACWDE9_22085, partial [Streptomyces olivaceoviridis]
VPATYRKVMGKLDSYTPLGYSLCGVVEQVGAYTDAVCERTVDQVVVEHGTTPADDLYQRLRAGSRNLGETDVTALAEGRPQDRVTHEGGTYQLFRIGDAVAHRNVHAALLDARRLCGSL